MAARTCLCVVVWITLVAGCHRSSGGRGSGGAAKIRLNEVMASNAGFAVVDESGQRVFSDWVELYNSTRSAVSLEGYSLTDNFQKPLKFQFPLGTVIGPNGYLLVFIYSEGRCELESEEKLVDCLKGCPASESDCVNQCESDHLDRLSRCSPPSGHVADFNLSRSADTLFLFAEDGRRIIDRLGVKNQADDITNGIDPDSGVYGVMYEPTPREPNRPVGLKLQRLAALKVRAVDEGQPIELELGIERDVAAKGELDVQVEWADVSKCGDPLAGRPLERASVVKISPAGGNPVRVDESRVDIEGNPTTAEVVLLSFLATLPGARCGTSRGVRIHATDAVGNLIIERCIRACAGDLPTVLVNEYQPKQGADGGLLFTRIDAEVEPGKNPTQRRDWIEIVNFGSQTVDISRLGLLGRKSVDEMLAGQEFVPWTFQEHADKLELAPGELFCVLADGDDGERNEYQLVDPAAGDTSRVFFSTRFKLSASCPEKGQPFDRFALVDIDAGTVLDEAILDFHKYDCNLKDGQSLARFPETEGLERNALVPGTLTSLATFEKPNTTEGDIPPIFREGVTIESEGSARCPRPGIPVTVRAQFNADRDRDEGEVKLSVGVTIDPPVEVPIAAPQVTEAVDQSKAAAGSTLHDITATIPGLPAGTLVVFDFKAEDLILTQKQDPKAIARYSEHEPLGAEVSFRYLVGFTPAADAPIWNEVLPGSDDSTAYPSPYAGVKQDFAEIYNPGRGELDLTGYYVTTTNLPNPGSPDPPIPNARRFQLSDAPRVPPGGFLPIFFGPPPAGAAPASYVEVKGFSLDCKDGEILYLIAPDAPEDGANCVVASIRWRLAETVIRDEKEVSVCKSNVAFGRVCDGCMEARCLAELARPTPGTSNREGILPLVFSDAFHEGVSGSKNSCINASDPVVQLKALFFVDEKLRDAFNESKQVISEASFFVDIGQGGGEKPIKPSRLFEGFPSCPQAGEAAGCSVTPTGYANGSITATVRGPFGAVVRYHVRLVDNCGNVLEAGPFTFGTSAGEHPQVVINESHRFFSVANDPDGLENARPWIELYNAGSTEADISGMYLSDLDTNPRKARLPGGLRLAPGSVLLVLTDGTDVPSVPRIDLDWSRHGRGTLFLSDSDSRGACLLDTFPFDFSALGEGVSLGRSPDGTGEVGPLPGPTPGDLNGAGSGAFVRGDANSDSRVNITDMVRILAILFQGDERRPDCEDALDVDDNGVLNAADAVYIGSHVFRRGPIIPLPFPTAGRDPTQDSLTPCGD